MIRTIVQQMISGSYGSETGADAFDACAVTYLR